jgi:hypothetical protein
MGNDKPVCRYVPTVQAGAYLPDDVCLRGADAERIAYDESEYATSFGFRIHVRYQCL